MKFVPLQMEQLAQVVDGLTRRCERQPRQIWQVIVDIDQVRKQPYLQPHRPVDELLKAAQDQYQRAIELISEESRLRASDIQRPLSVAHNFVVKALDAYAQAEGISTYISPIRSMAVEMPLENLDGDAAAVNQMIAEQLSPYNGDYTIREPKQIRFARRTDPMPMIYRHGIATATMRPAQFGPGFEIWLCFADAPHELWIVGRYGNGFGNRDDAELILKLNYPNVIYHPSPVLWARELVTFKSHLAEDYQVKGLVDVSKAVVKKAIKAVDTLLRTISRVIIAVPMMLTVGGLMGTIYSFREAVRYFEIVRNIVLYIPERIFKVDWSYAEEFKTIIDGFDKILMPLSEAAKEINEFAWQDLEIAKHPKLKRLFDIGRWLHLISVVKRVKSFLKGTLMFLYTILEGVDFSAGQEDEDASSDRDKRKQRLLGDGGRQGQLLLPSGKGYLYGHPYRAYHSTNNDGAKSVRLIVGLIRATIKLSKSLASSITVENVMKVVKLILGVIDILQQIMGNLHTNEYAAHQSTIAKYQDVLAAASNGLKYVAERGINPEEIKMVKEIYEKVTGVTKEVREAATAGLLAPSVS